MTDADRTPRARRQVSGRGSTRSSGLFEARGAPGYGYAQVQPQAPQGYSHNSQPGTQSQVGYPQAGGGPGPGYDPYGSHRGLRPMDSRFSLNDHFAASRREYEFGDDDASSVFGGRAASILPRGAEAESQLEGEVRGDEVVVAGDEEDAPGEEDREDDDDEANFYEVLCVGRDGLTKEEVRRAYWRWFELLYPASCEEDVARIYFARVQDAFETLVDQEKRWEYDSSQGRAPPRRSQVEVSSDMGVRADASGRGRGLRPVDFMLGHSVSAGVPGLGRAVEEKFKRVKALLARTSRDRGVISEMTGLKGGATFTLSDPIVTISGYAYGLTEALPSTALSERYHPLLHIVPRQKVHLLGNLYPLATLNLHQDLLARDSSSGELRGASGIEVESDLLPTPSLTTRVSHSAVIRGSATSLGAGLTASRLSPGRPQVSIAGSRVWGDGVAFARLDSGNWRVRADETCRFFTEFSRLNGRVSSMLGPRAASFEVGYTKGTSCEALVPHQRAMSLLKEEKQVSSTTPSSWTASLGGTMDYLVSSLRYATSIPAASPTRLEVEFCASNHADHHVAIRNVFPIGSSFLGLELSLSPRTFHFSLSVSYLNQRFSLPIYMLPAPRSLFLAAVVPLLASAGFHFFRSKKRAAANKGKGKGKGKGRKGDKRSEADALAFLLHRSLSRRPDSAKGENLIIVSAKYGAAEDEWAGEHVADVTIALSALVRDGKVDIPAGLRTSHLPGFWDPAPGRVKALRVGFRIGGREGVVEAKEGEGLRIP
ncbi:uncharacterized protein DNG_10338 [Cephalotrichum gorgonifer]|uniref:J domain-containing protein n=1 Tax=Cephalotrichum gorgonifer TaxID=2041049 RepID=A0AAE8N8Y2_9PEZI|nr:uncharacterized protein DNG_10338 [Cephalotrichum gorgonifer]